MRFDDDRLFHDRTRLLELLDEGLAIPPLRRCLGVEAKVKAFHPQQIDLVKELIFFQREQPARFITLADVEFRVLRDRL